MISEVLRLKMKTLLLCLHFPCLFLYFNIHCNTSLHKNSYFSSLAFCFYDMHEQTEILPTYFASHFVQLWNLLMLYHYLYRSLFKFILHCTKFYLLFCFVLYIDLFKCICYCGVLFSYQYSLKYNTGICIMLPHLCTVFCCLLCICIHWY